MCERLPQIIFINILCSLDETFRNFCRTVTKYDYFDPIGKIWNQFEIVRRNRKTFIRNT